MTRTVAPFQSSQENDRCLEQWHQSLLQACHMIHVHASNEKCRSAGSSPSRQLANALMTKKGAWA
eukprot:1496448-Amphidinium_carterae.1